MTDMHNEAVDIIYKEIYRNKNELAGTREAVKMGVLGKADTKAEELKINRAIEVLEWVISLIEADAEMNKCDTTKTECTTEQKMNEYIEEKHLQNDMKPPTAASGEWKCPYCGVTYNRKPLLCCYAGCKRKVRENDDNRSEKL